MDKQLVTQLLLLKKGIQKENNTKFDKLQKEFFDKIEKIQLQKGDTGDDYSITDKDYDEIASLVTLPTVKDGEDYILTDEDKTFIASLIELPVPENGKDYVLTDDDKEEIASLVPILELPEFAEKSIEEIRDSLEDLTDEEKLDVLKLKNLDKIELDAKQIKNLPQGSTSNVRPLQKLSISGQELSLSGANKVEIPSPDLSLALLKGNNLSDLLDAGTARSNLGVAQSIIDTRENIISQTPPNGTNAFATDTKEDFKYINGWQQNSTLFKERTGAFDAGVIQDSNLSGYGKDYVSQKHLANITIGDNRETKEGGTRVVFSQTLQKRIAQYYLDGAWKTVLSGINIVTDKNESPADIEVTDFEPYNISLISGNSDSKDFNGVPIIQNMKSDAGIYQSPIQINGGTF